MSWTGRFDLVLRLQAVAATWSGSIRGEVDGCSRVKGGGVESGSGDRFDFRTEFK